MPRDQRWTGGLANREWQSGTPVEQPADTGAVTAQVKEYLSDCRRWASTLRASDHPTEDGVLKVVYHRGDTQKQAVLDAYRQLTRTRATKPD